MILTPDETEWLESLVRRYGNQTQFAIGELESIFDTLAAYAEVVRKVAEGGAVEDCSDMHGPYYVCSYCDAVSRTTAGALVHYPDCPYIQARKLLGIEP